MGNALPEFVPYGVYRTTDGYLALVVVADHHWERLCATIGREELADDERFATGSARIDHREAVEELLTEAFATASADEWFDRLRERGVSAAPVYDSLEVRADEQVRADEHVRSRDLLTTVHDGNRETNAIRYPVGFETIDAEIADGVPDLGEHTGPVLAAAGVGDETIKTLVSAVESPPSS